MKCEVTKKGLWTSWVIQCYVIPNITILSFFKDTYSS